MIAARITELRKKTGKTQGEISKILGIPRSTYSNYELGNREPDAEVFKKISDYYGVSIDYLMGNENTTNDQARNAVIEAYNRLPQSKKKLVDDMIKALLDERK